LRLSDLGAVGAIIFVQSYRHNFDAINKYINIPFLKKIIVQPSATNDMRWISSNRFAI